MKTKAVRIYGKNDLRFEEFDLPAIKQDEILAQVICDSLCMSTYKAVKQGIEHKRIPEDVHIHPTIIGHEFSGIIVEVGDKWKKAFTPGMKFTIQPALRYPKGPVGILSAPGYSYRYTGGDATHIILTAEIMEQDCLVTYNGKGFYPAALTEPLSCVIGAMHACYHTRPGSYEHIMDIFNGGNMAILGGAGPMGLAAINYVIHRKDRKPGILVVTDIDQTRLDRAAKLISPRDADRKGVKLHYLNSINSQNSTRTLLEITGNTGYQDVFVFVPSVPVAEQGDEILATDGCLNFFAGPEDAGFRAKLNMYDVHYNFTHIMGTSGGNTSDLKESMDMMSDGFNPAGLITHIGGLNAAAKATLKLPEIPGGKKLIYNNIEMPLTALNEFGTRKHDPLFVALASITEKHNGLWSYEAEEWLIRHAKPI